MSKLSKHNSILTALNKMAEEESDVMLIDVKNAYKYSNYDEDFLKEIFISFLEEVPIYLTDLRAAMLLQNGQKVSELAHKIKSPVQIVGADTILALLDELEVGASNKTPNWQTLYSCERLLNARCETLFKQINTAIQQVK